MTKFLVGAILLASGFSCLYFMNEKNKEINRLCKTVYELNHQIKKEREDNFQTKIRCVEKRVTISG